MAEAQEKRTHLDTRLAAAFGRDVFVRERGGPGYHEATLMARDLAALLDKLDEAKVDRFELQRIMGDRDRACDLVTGHREAWQRLRQAVERIIPGFVARPGEHAAEQAVRALEELTRLRGVTKAELRDVKRRLRERYDEVDELGRIVSCDWGEGPTPEDPIAVTVSRRVNSQVRVNTYVLEERAAQGVHVGSAETRQPTEPGQRTVTVGVMLMPTRDEVKFRGFICAIGGPRHVGPWRKTHKEAHRDSYELLESWCKSDDEAEPATDSADAKDRIRSGDIGVRVGDKSTKYRAELQVGGRRHVGYWRTTEAEAERDLETLRGTVPSHPDEDDVGVAGDPHPPRTATNLRAVPPSSPEAARDGDGTTAPGVRALQAQVGGLMVDIDLIRGQIEDLKDSHLVATNRPDQFGQVYALLSQLGERLGRLEARLG